VGEPVNNTAEDFEDFFEGSLCGFIIADPKGIIIRANANVARWTNTEAAVLKGRRFSDLLSIGGKIYYETHLSPLLRMQGFFDEVVLELAVADGRKMRVMVNALERKNAGDNPGFIRYTIIKASDRLLYEKNLQIAKTGAEQALLEQKEIVTLREQLIAVLGHDLRNPLSAIGMAVELLEISLQGEQQTRLVQTLKRSTGRMKELVDNIMDFARTRLGESIVLNREEVLLQPVLQQVTDELRLGYPNRQVLTTFNIEQPVHCDVHRIAQLVSNLLANAFTHGSTDAPVIFRAAHKDNILELAVCNKGEPIPEIFRENLFAPFTRESSQNGLGLGLYICSEIARAHKGLLSFSSTEEETCFTFRMPV